MWLTEVLNDGCSVCWSKNYHLGEGKFTLIFILRKHNYSLPFTGKIIPHKMDSSGRWHHHLCSKRLEFLVYVILLLLAMAGEQHLVIKNMVCSHVLAMIVVQSSSFTLYFLAYITTATFCLWAWVIVESGVYVTSGIWGSIVSLSGVSSEGLAPGTLHMGISLVD